RPVIDARAANVGRHIRRKDLVQRHYDAIGRGAVNRPVMIINTTNSQRTSECEAMRGTAHLGFRSDHEDLAERSKSRLEGLNAFGVNAVVVRDKNSRFCHFFEL